MLAVKLHKTKYPYLGVNSYLIPIIDWISAKPLILQWYKHLNKGGGQDTSVKYISLVKVPDTHLVAMYLRSSAKTFTAHTFLPLGEIPRELKEQFAEEYRKAAERGRLIQPEDLAEIVLGAPLPRKYVKWTKRIKLLYGKEASGRNRKIRR